MLSAKRKSDGVTVHAYFEKKSNGPFLCLECGNDVILKNGRRKVDHFAHANPLICARIGESDLHLRCKLEIFKALQAEPEVEDLTLERSFGEVRPDIYAKIKGLPVAIEVQISSLSVEQIMERTIWYYRKGIYVLWLLPWTPELDAKRYAPKPWERWLHACYFGRVYYWIGGLNIIRYRFEPFLNWVPRKSLFYTNGHHVSVGGFSGRSDRYRAAVREEDLNLAKDFSKRERSWWSGHGVTVPDAKLFCDLKPAREESNPNEMGNRQKERELPTARPHA